MPKVNEKQNAITLRKRGLSYAEILEKVPVAKSTLSLWLRSVGLSKKQKQRLTQKKLASMQRGWQKVHELRMLRWKKLREKACAEIGGLSRRERWLIGISLYWAEGSKEKESGSATAIKFSNSDPAMILLFQKWIKEFFNVPKDKMYYELYIHEKADWKSAIKFWKSYLNVSERNIRVYFKRHNENSKRKNIGMGYIGLIRIVVPDSIQQVRTVSGWVEGIHKNWGIV